MKNGRLWAIRASFKLADRLRALELYGKAQCYYAEKMELTGFDGNPIATNNMIIVEFVSARTSPAQETEKSAPVEV